MIKTINYSSSKNQKLLIKILDQRRSGKNINTEIVSKILNEIKKNKIKAVLKYEKKFSNNKHIYPKKTKLITL